MNLPPPDSTRKTSTNLEPGDTFGINGFKKRGHIVTFVQDYAGYALFFDSLTGEIFTLAYKEIDIAMKKFAAHPFRNDILIFDYIEKLPEDVFEVVKINALHLLKRGVSSAQIL